MCKKGIRGAKGWTVHPVRSYELQDSKGKPAGLWTDREVRKGDDVPGEGGGEERGRAAGFRGTRAQQFCM